MYKRQGVSSGIKRERFLDRVNLSPESSAGKNLFDLNTEICSTKKNVVQTRIFRSNFKFGDYIFHISVV